MSDLILPNKDIINIDRTIQTDIFNYRSSEFFINMKESDIPPKGHPDRADFIKWEREKCRIGLTVGGVYIPGNLYFHFNHFYLIGDEGEDESGRTQNVAKIATLRDNDWIIHTEYARAVKEKKGYCLASSRQIGKTTCLTALTLREVSLYDNAEALLIFGSLQDKQSFTKKIKVGIEHGQPFIIRTPIDKDWNNKTEIRFGYTNKDNTTVEKARIFLYNVDGGSDSEKGAGKALLHGSKVYYSDREGVIENCKVGDKIFGRDGKLTTITGVYPQGVVDIYQITFGDGRTVRCCKDHLWEVEKMSKLRVNEDKIKVVNTQYLLNNHKRVFFNSKKNKTVYSNVFKIQKHECLDYPYKEVTLNPYYLGYWLGDGTTNCLGEITTIDEEIITFLNNYTKETGGVLTNKRKITYRIESVLGNKNPSPITTLAKKYNLRKNKHIPNEYLYNSKEIRLEVLRGILDSDAHIDKRGRIELSLSDKKLTDDCIFLIRSLGINCSVTEKIGSYKKNGVKILCKTVYRIYLGIVTKERLFNLTRKADAQKLGNIKWSIQNGTSIEKIEYYGKGEATCISVDNKDRMFLTDNFIPTHNTVTLFAMDECGKYPFQASWEAVEPALKGKNGYRSAPYFSWTGGDTEKAKEAFKFTLNPEASNLLEFETEGKKTSKVMFATYRQDCKVKVPFTNFLDKEKIIYDKKNKNLKSLTIEISDVEEATRKTLKELEDKKKDKDPLASIKHRAYYPLCLKDILARETKNNFNKEFIDQQLEYLKDVGYDKVEVFRDIKTGEVKHKFSFAPVIEDWRKPVFLDTPVKIWDFPKHTEYGVHVIGLDSVREDETNSSDSLAYFTVLRRLHSDLEDPFRGKQVASWLGRKKTVKEMLQLLLDVAEWYNAQILYEHVDRSVLDFFESKRKMHLLIDTIPLQKEIAIKTKTKNNKGLRPTVANQQFLLNSTLGWVNEDLEDDSLGYSRVMDEVLLNQLAEYDPEENLDCYIGFSHAVAAYNYFEKFGVPEVPNSNKEQITSNKKPVIYNAFGIPFNKKSKSVFGF